MQLVPILPDSRERIQECVNKFGHTSDHNMDWFIDSVITSEGEPVFVQWPDGTGLLAHHYPDEWRIWSDPLCSESEMAQRISEFATKVFEDKNIRNVWCDDVSDLIYPALRENGLNLEPIYYSLFWPVLDLSKFSPALPGGHFKEMRNAKNKFYKEHKLEVADAKEFSKEKLRKIIYDWKQFLPQNKEDIYDLRYHNTIEHNFRGFVTSRVLIVDGIPVGINAGYDVPNKPGRFAGIIGIHDYSVRDIGIVFYLEDLEWMKNSGYAEVDLQGSEEDEGLEFKLRFGARVERKTDTFCIKK